MLWRDALSCVCYLDQERAALFLGDQADSTAALRIPDPVGHEIADRALEERPIQSGDQPGRLGPRGKLDACFTRRTLVEFAHQRQFAPDVDRLLLDRGLSILGAREKKKALHN